MDISTKRLERVEVVKVTGRVDHQTAPDLEKALRLYEGFQEGGQVAPLQVDQVRSTLLNARNTVLKDMQDTANALDQFKLQRAHLKECEFRAGRCVPLM